MIKKWKVRSTFDQHVSTNILMYEKREKIVHIWKFVKLTTGDYLFIRVFGTIERIVMRLPSIFFFQLCFASKQDNFFGNAVFKVKLNELTMKHPLVLIKRIFQHDISSFLCVFFFQTNVSINWNSSGVYVCTCIHVHKNRKAITYRVT